MLVAKQETMTRPAASSKILLKAGMTAFSAFGGREAAGLYSDQFEIYHGNSNPDLARKISRYLGTEPGRLLTTDEGSSPK